MSQRLIRIVAGSLLVMSMHAGQVMAETDDVMQLLDQAIAGSHRSEANQQRDQYRHPKETLTFFGLRPDMTVVEITPGGGWYTEILAPVLRDHGKYYAATLRITEQSSPFFKNMDASYQAKLKSDPSVYGNVTLVHFDPASPEFAPAGSADLVVTFRNVHNWAQAGNAEVMFKGFAAVLAPGGYLGVVEHRAKPGTSFDDQVKSGYMTEEYVIGLARKAGFSLVEGKDINANPKDTRNHPGGVWNLLPNLRDVPEADKAKMRAIGESDRMTLLFVKD